MNTTVYDILLNDDANEFILNDHFKIMFTNSGKRFLKFQKNENCNSSSSIEYAKLIDTDEIVDITLWDHHDIGLKTVSLFLKNRQLPSLHSIVDVKKAS